MGIFTRLFKISQAEAHSAIDQLEDPIKMTEQGLRDLRTDLDKSVQTLAELKAIEIRMRKTVENKRAEATDFERKAMLLLQKAQARQIAPEEADRLASAALEQKRAALEVAAVEVQNLHKLENQVALLDQSIKKLRNTIGKHESELKTLQARAKVVETTSNMNKQLAMVDSSSTIAMLERMRDKVENEEALAAAYGDIAEENKSLEEEIDSALESHSTSIEEALAAMKAKMALNAPPPSGH